MSYLTILVVSFLVTLSLGSPVARQTSLCPSNGVPNATKFTLLAVSKADTNVKKPLALGFPAPITTVPEAFLGTAESIDPYLIVAQDFVLVDGGITSYALKSGDPVFVSNAVEKENGWLSFHPFKVGPPAKVYCESFNTDLNGVEYPYALTVNGGDSDSFSLCQSNTSDTFVVIYNAVEASSKDAGYEWTSCTAVYVHTLPVTR